MTWDFRIIADAFIKFPSEMSIGLVVIGLVTFPSINYPVIHLTWLIRHTQPRVSDTMSPSSISKQFLHKLSEL